MFTLSVKAMSYKKKTARKLETLENKKTRIF